MSVWEVMSALGKATKKGIEKEYKKGLQDLKYKYRSLSDEDFRRVYRNVTNNPNAPASQLSIIENEANRRRRLSRF